MVYLKKQHGSQELNNCCTMERNNRLFKTGNCYVWPSEPHRFSLVLIKEGGPVCKWAVGRP